MALEQVMNPRNRDSPLFFESIITIPSVMQKDRPELAVQRGIGPFHLSKDDLTLYRNRGTEVL